MSVHTAELVTVLCCSQGRDEDRSPIMLVIRAGKRREVSICPLQYSAIFLLLAVFVFICPLHNKGILEIDLASSAESGPHSAENVEPYKVFLQQLSYYPTDLGYFPRVKGPFLN
ncbi:unnamed protein product [Pleuronectes platessa]|uniref:Uncharacterized protein n=1 Tax=Pleuronectes platessa TaxID=8262 RepID=A0A9N7U7W4_PLEPL|nr:unnamed protein product [Pleuronectes platessa]